MFGAETFYKIVNEGHSRTIELGFLLRQLPFYTPKIKQQIESM